MAFVVRRLIKSNSHIVKDSTLLRNISLSCCQRDIFNVQDSDDFQNRVLKSDKPVIVDFHGTWCKPCKMLNARLETLMNRYGEQIHLARVDIEKNDSLVHEYQVSSVPVVLAVKNGEVCDKFVGLKEDDMLEAFIRKLIEQRTKKA